MAGTGSIVTVNGVGTFDLDYPIPIGEFSTAHALLIGEAIRIANSRGLLANTNAVGGHIQSIIDNLRANAALQGANAIGALQAAARDAKYGHSKDALQSYREAAKAAATASSCMRVVEGLRASLQDH